MVRQKKTNRFPLGPSGKTRVKSLYDEHRKYPPYDELTTKSQITGIWDDHDFNQNNGDKYNPTKEWVQQMFLDFLDEPKDSARRSQPGLYTSFQYGSGDRSVRLIFIDIRYFADSRFFDGPNVDLLGKLMLQFSQGKPQIGYTISQLSIFVEF